MSIGLNVDARCSYARHHGSLDTRRYLIYVVIVMVAIQVGCAAKPARPLPPRKMPQATCAAPTSMTLSLVMAPATLRGDTIVGDGEEAIGLAPFAKFSTFRDMLYFLVREYGLSPAKADSWSIEYLRDGVFKPAMHHDSFSFPPAVRLTAGATVQYFVFRY